MGGMKNLMVYVSPAGGFNEEYGLLTKVQIDNSLNLGWKPEDILLVTSFDYEYNGVKAVVVSLDNFCAVRPRSIKTSIIPNLIDLGTVKKGELYWNHDLDAFQMDTINESELGLESLDLGLTDYGWRSRWCMGSFFFKESAGDIFKLMKPEIFNDIEDETVMMGLTGNNANNVNERSKRLNITYNFGQRNVESNYEKATKPIKVVHFHPSRKAILDIFMYGKNGMNAPIMNERLTEVFKQHGIR